MKGSRIAAAVIVLAAAGWIASGHFGDARTPPPPAPAAAEAPRFRVAVMPVEVRPHQRSIVLSGRTEADKRATAVARATGIVVDLRVRRGSHVKTGDVVAVLSDEAREANVAQAKAKLEHRRSDYEAKMRLIRSGTMAALNQPQLEAELRAAEAVVAQMEAERSRGEVLAPVSGVVNEVPVEVGQALQVGAMVAEVIALDPMLAVVEIAERQLGGVSVGDQAEVRLVTGQTTRGQVRFISRKASPQTRTYRVEIGVDNASGAIPDGVTAEVALRLAAVPAARIPRSALTFSGEGKLGVRAVDAAGRVSFVPVAVVEDGQQELWLAGIAGDLRVIVQGQDFVKEGELVEAVPVAARG
ncbi:MAG TPA: efflux RND transporter periplasmic adaptor subunit [Microvirga sp.]|jgi:multidrug efflux system membrane fusion protein|nr:efflux RND transporter periplasmic adaptor subunit [Microvirga sp.]